MAGASGNVLSNVKKNLWFSSGASDLWSRLFFLYLPLS